MQLPRHELELFLKLHPALMCFVNLRLKVLPNALSTPGEFAALSPEIRVKVRDALNSNLELIQAFVDENPANLSDSELDIVCSWRHLVAGKFYVMRELKKYTLFLSTTSPAISYGVQALSQPIGDLVGPNQPVLTETVLLPFKDKIVYDGLMSRFSISFGAGMKRELNRFLKEAKERHGIVTSLPMSPTPLLPKVPKAKSVPKQPTKEKRKSRWRSSLDWSTSFAKSI